MVTTPAPQKKLWLPIALLSIGVLAIAFGTWGIVSSVTDIFRGQTFNSPGETAADLESEEYLVYLRVGDGSVGSVNASDIEVTGPGGDQVTVRRASGASLTINNRSYMGIARFTADQAGSYRIASTGGVGELRVGVDFVSSFGRFGGGFAAIGLGALAALAGLIWLIARAVGNKNRRQHAALSTGYGVGQGYGAGYGQPYGGQGVQPSYGGQWPTQSAAQPSTGAAPAGWYPDVERPGSLRYWDGTAWTEYRHPPA